ncbi:MAG: acyltransferase [Bacteroidales bacterium]|nr:acyltransferase [Bacteroidales bacterium]
MDAFRMIAAILVVFQHTYCIDMGKTGAWLNLLSDACVPFFLIVSGFLFKNSFKGTDEWFRKYMMRIVWMYLAWSVITLPVSYLIIERGHCDYSVPMKILYQLRLFFFTGSIGVYWYLLALGISLFLIYHAYRRKLIWPLGILAIAGYVIGCLYNSPFHHGQTFYEGIHVVFGSTRNFLNVGLFYTLIGFLWPAPETRDRTTFFKIAVLSAMVLSVLVRGVESNYCGTSFSQALIAISAFAGALYLFPVSEARGLTESRNLSTGIYLIHYPFILLFDFYLTRGTAMDFPITLAFSVAVYYILRRFLPKSSGILFGLGRAS